MFRFASPLFLLLIMVVVLILFLKFKKKSFGHIKVSSLNGVESLSLSFMVRLSKFIPGLKIIALVLLILALARPQWGDKKMNVTTEGVNIILALDLSESMRALDFKKDDKIVTRLEAVKHVVRQFIMKREGDRIGMVVFGSNAFTQLPLTRDYNTIAFILDRLEIGAAGPRTAIGDAIGISLKRLEDIQSKSNIIILLTDGKSNSGELAWQDAVKIAAKRKVKIYTIGVGTKGEAPFLVDGLFGKRYVYQKVDVDLDALKKIADQTSGSFFQAGDIASLEQIYEMINSLEKTKVDVEKWVEYKELYPGLLIMGLIFFVLYILLSNTRFLRIP
ncbi:MAG: VWA domain-containing protein [Proteobacteria bacterium]|nr:VWA domain-containing protein [Pseudomonadota bacterium]MBU1585995.1 VWA domain-containing protein [Pseudomonadota bacterium]MBU2452649.1 VWA domain-containing protein [Pseudomonadota bacterium]MBU2630092.1 VWA domain-containing protein [Pseudomonadota bacterium]